MNSQSFTTKFCKFIKIRIGEPVTAIDSDDCIKIIQQDSVIFGSITGYLGFYYYTTNEIKYIPFLYEEVIRNIHITQKQKSYIIVGDYQSLYLDNVTTDIKSTKINRVHLQKQCQTTITLLKVPQLLLISVTPIQGSVIKQQDHVVYIQNLSNNNDNNNNNLCQYNNNNHNQVTTHNFTASNLFVPFDFDGQRLLLLQYLPKGQKSFLILNLQNDKLQVLDEPKAEIVSFVKFYCDNSIIYIENDKTLIQLINKQQLILKLMKYPIVALDLNSQQQITLIDEEGNVSILQNKQELHNFNIFKYILLLYTKNG